MDFTELFTKGGPAGIIAGLFVFVLMQLLKSNKEQQEAHRAEIKEMRQEHSAQMTSITQKFSDELKNFATEFSAGMNSMKEGINHIADELRDMKQRIDPH